MQSVNQYADKLPSSILVALSLFGYLLLALFFPLIPNFDQEPPLDIRSFTPTLLDAVLYVSLIVSLFVLFAMLYRRVVGAWKPSPAYVSGIAFILGIPLLFMYPINANDVYRYVLRGIISGKLKANPYEQAPAEFDGVINASLGGEWADAVSPYGPLWELVASLLTFFGQDDFLFSIMLFKLLGLLSLIAAGIILWQILGLRENGTVSHDNRRTGFMALFIWNPALLLSFVGNAHNDILMITVLLLGWLIIIRGDLGPGFLIMFAAALIKPIALIALPIILIHSWRNADSIRTRVYFLLWAVVGGILLGALAFLPFGNPRALVVRLLTEAGGGASFSPATLLILLARQMDLGVSISTVAMTATAIFLLFYLWIIWQVWRVEMVEKSIGLAFWGYLFQALNFRLWYATWPFPWLLLDAYRGGSVYWLHASLWFLVTSQLSVIIYGHLRTFLLNHDYFTAHLIGIPFVFIMPFILAPFTNLVEVRPNDEAAQVKTG